jgi:hypothetical protein
MGSLVEFQFLFVGSRQGLGCQGTFSTAMGMGFGMGLICVHLGLLGLRIQ